MGFAARIMSISVSPIMPINKLYQLETCYTFRHVNSTVNGARQVYCRLVYAQDKQDGKSIGIDQENQ